MLRLLAVLLALASACALFAADLPITNVVLFSSGVGYFQRTGTVQGNAAVQLSFKAEQINDLLKSLVLLDLDGGKVGTVTYAAKDPISKTLQSFAVNITDNPSLAQLLNRLRGVEIEVTATNTVTGKILGVETKEKQAGEHVITVEVLNLLTPAGIRAIRLDEVTTFRLLDDRLNKELQDALLVLATGLDNQRKPAVVSFNGEKTRRVVVGYLLETPVWKTSYRLVSDEKGALLQGWGMVENTSDEDWTNVRLSLVSGRPISFIQDLYSSFYIQRPVYRPQWYASIGPVSYGGGIPSGQNGKEASGRDRETTPPLPPLAGPRGPSGDLADGSYMNGEALQPKRDTMGSSVISAALARDLGQGFEYAIKEAVTLPRQQSALLPIVTAPIATTRVSIYNYGVNQRYPLHGMKLKNTTGVHLMGGPITVYDNGVYAGDATFENLQPGEERLISYAVDLGLTPLRTDEGGTQTITALKIVQGQMTVTRKLRKTVVYTFMPKDGKDRTVIVEHPLTQGWTLVEPKTADERTDALYRFTVPVSGKTGGKLTVSEEIVNYQTLALVNMDTNTLLMYAATAKIDKPISDALKRAVEMQNALAELRRTRTLKEQEIRTITQEQERIRQNMNALDRGSDLYKRLVQKLDEQETRIEQLRNEIVDLQKREEEQRKAFEAYIHSLNLAQEF